MKTIVNIGTNKGNIVGIEFNKAFDDIVVREILDVVYEKFGYEVRLQGWADVTPKQKIK